MNSWSTLMGPGNNITYMRRWRQIDSNSYSEVTSWNGTC